MDDTTASPTRRDYIKYGGAVVGGGLLAGCADSGPQSSPTDGHPATDSQTDRATTDDGYSVTMSPMGEVTFDAVPEDVFTILTHHAGMALALGRADAINAMHAPEYYQSLWNKFLHRLDGVAVDWTGLYSSWPPSKEKLYELDSDVHLADPAKVDSAEGWSTDDVAEVTANVAPFFGNTFSATHQQPPEAWADGYEYYTLWEIFEKVAQVFQEQARYEALAEVRASMLDRIESGLPPESERPSAALVLFSTSDDQMWGYKLNYPGYYAAHTRPLGATDALAAAVGEGYGDDGRNLTLDFELLLDADPDVLLVLGPMTDYHDIDEIRSTLADHDVASAMTAVEEGRAYTQGTRNQGPIVNLFQTEMAAKQLYPDAFGEWPGYEDGEPYPKIPEDEQLFDRQRVADIVNGAFEQ
ncbi:ABC transporter substrate-binding protein [Haloarcula salina]|uniref:ABC transporter substrate-binding protein n=1 Tax=Haloarcula salina TaxID=1429914 RepID=UPI003C6FBD1C